MHNTHSSGQIINNDKMFNKIMLMSEIVNSDNAGEFDIAMIVYQKITAAYQEYQSKNKALFYKFVIDSCKEMSEETTEKIIKAINLSDDEKSLLLDMLKIVKKGDDTYVR